MRNDYVARYALRLEQNKESFMAKKAKKAAKKTKKAAKKSCCCCR